MSSGPISLLSELDLCICANGGVARLESSAASSDRAVITLRETLQKHVTQHGDKPLDEAFVSSIPVELPPWVPKNLRVSLTPASMTTMFKMASTSEGRSSRKAAVLRLRAELAKAKEARLAAELKKRNMTNHAAD